MVEKFGNSPEQKAFKKEEPVDLKSLQDDIQRGSSSAFFNEEREGVITTSNSSTKPEVQSKKKKKSTLKSKYSPSSDEEREKMVSAAVDAIQEGIAKNKKEDDPTDFQSLIETNIPKDKNEIFDTDEEEIDPIILFSELSDDAQKLLQDRMTADNKELFKQGNFLLPDVIAILQQNGFKEEVDTLVGEATVHDYSKEDAVNDTIFREVSNVATTSPYEREDVSDDVHKSKTESPSLDSTETIFESTEAAVDSATKSEATTELQEFNNQLQHYSLSEAGVSVINEQKSLSAKKHMLELLLKEAPEVKPETAEDTKEVESHVSTEDKEAKPEIEQSATIRVKDFSPALQSYLHKLAEKGFMTFKEYDNEAVIVGKDLDELREQELFVDEIEQLQSKKVSPHTTEVFDKAIPEAERDYSDVESFTDAIRNSKTFSDMYQAVDTIDYVEGTLGFYTKSQLKHLIGMVERGEQDPIVITQNAGLRAKVYELLGYDGEVSSEQDENTPVAVSEQIPEDKELVESLVTTNEEDEVVISGLKDALHKITDEEKESTIGNDGENEGAILSLEDSLKEITDEEKESTIGGDGDETIEPIATKPVREITGLNEALEDIPNEEKESPLKSETPQEKIAQEFFQIKQTYFEAFRRLKESVKTETLIDKIKNKFGSKESEQQKRFNNVRNLYSSKAIQFIPVLFESRLSQENEERAGQVCFGDLSETAQIQLQQMYFARSSDESYNESTIVALEDVDSLVDGGAISAAEVARIRALETHAGVTEEVRVGTWSDMFIAERDALFEIEASVFDKKSMTIAQRLLSKINKKETPETTVGKTRWETLIKLS